MLRFRPPLHAPPRRRVRRAGSERTHLRDSTRRTKMLITHKRLLGGMGFAWIAAGSGMSIGVASDQKRGPKHSSDRMSAMGRAAARARKAVQSGLPAVKAAKDFEQSGVCVNEPECEGGDEG